MALRAKPMVTTFPASFRYDRAVLVVTFSKDIPLTDAILSPLLMRPSAAARPSGSTVLT